MKNPWIQTISLTPPTLQDNTADTDRLLNTLKARLIIDGLNTAILNLCKDNQLEPQNIYALSVAGNTTMTHLFMGLDPRWIIREPYIPAVNTPEILKAQTLGLHVHPRARVLIFPNVASYFGGDLIAGILFSEICKNDETAILVDVGTNAEVVLGNKNWLMACAGAAGPALEGGVTRMAMTAGPGVIDKIEIDPDTHEIRIHTIEELAPKGICGSGVIDLELNVNQEFMNRFSAAKFLPHTDPKRFPSVKPRRKQ